MDYKIFSSNRSILQSSAIHPIIATADKSGHFVPVGVTSAFAYIYLYIGYFCENIYAPHTDRESQTSQLDVLYL